MKLYLDDERPTPEGWTRAFTATQAIDLLKAGNVEHLSLDHDLGAPENGTGYDVVLWIESEVVRNVNYVPPWMSIHSANPVGRQNMERAMKSIQRFVEKNLMTLDQNNCL